MKKRYKKILNKTIVDSFKTNIYYTSYYMNNFSSFTNISKVFGQSYSNIFVIYYTFYYNELDRLNGVLDLKIIPNRSQMLRKCIKDTLEIRIGKEFHNYLAKTIKEKFVINIKAKVITYNDVDLDNQVAAFFQ